MLRTTLSVCFLVLFAIRPASSGNVEAECLAAITTGDATINCQKALVLLQRKQLELLLDIRRLIAKGANRSTARTVTNTGMTVKKLEEIARILLERGARPSDTLFVTDANVLGGSRFSCESEISDECVNPAKQAADDFCRGLGYRGQQAHAFEGPKGAEHTVRIKWVACRP